MKSWAVSRGVELCGSCLWRGADESLQARDLFWEVGWVGLKL